MRYQHFCAPNGDITLKILLKCKDKMGSRYTNACGAYACRKAGMTPAIRWREPASKGLPYGRITYVEI